MKRHTAQTTSKASASPSFRGQSPRGRTPQNQDRYRQDLSEHGRSGDRRASEGQVQRADAPLAGAAAELDQQRIDRILKIARWMDSAYRVPGTNLRIGLDGILGLIPGVGDVGTSLISLYAIYSAQQLGASRWTLTRMAGNLALDLALGAIPLVGDAFDFFFKSNRRNVRLLEKHLRKQAEKSKPRVRQDQAAARSWLNWLTLGRRQTT